MSRFINKSRFTELFISLMILVQIIFNNFSIYYWVKFGWVVYYSSLIILMAYVIPTIMNKISVTYNLFLFFALSFIASISSSISQSISLLISSFIAPLLIGFASKKNQSIWKITCKFYLWLVIIGFVLYLWTLLFDYSAFIVDKPHDNREYYCYLLSCRNDLSIRYAFIFEEPGTLAGVSALLLVLGAFRKKEALALIFINIFTLSLFFYIFLLFYIFYNNIIRGEFTKNKVFRTMPLIGILMLIVVILMSTDSELIDYNIKRRFIFDDNLLPTIVNNRTDDTFNEFYSGHSYFDLILGIHEPIIEIYNGWTGLIYKTYILEHGFLVLIMKSLLLFSMVKERCNIKFTIYFAIFFIMFFYQRPLFFRPEYLGIFLMWYFYSEKFFKKNDLSHIVKK